MKAKLKSSRSRMQRRARQKGRSAQVPTPIGQSVAPNRARKRVDLVMRKRQKKAAVLQEIRRKRQDRLVKIRRVRAQIRKETRAAMRA
jgi:hypothetical protein